MSGKGASAGAGRRPPLIPHGHTNMDAESQHHGQIEHSDVVIVELAASPSNTRASDETHDAPALPVRSDSLSYHGDVSATVAARGIALGRTDSSSSRQPSAGNTQGDLAAGNGTIAREPSVASAPMFTYAPAPAGPSVTSEVEHLSSLAGDFRSAVGQAQALAHARIAEAETASSVSAAAMAAGLPATTGMAAPAAAGSAAQSRAGSSSSSSSTAAVAVGGGMAAAAPAVQDAVLRAALGAIAEHASAVSAAAAAGGSGLPAAGAGAGNDALTAFLTRQMRDRSGTVSLQSGIGGVDVLGPLRDRAGTMSLQGGPTASSPLLRRVATDGSALATSNTSSSSGAPAAAASSGAAAGASPSAAARARAASSRTIGGSSDASAPPILPTALRPAGSSVGVACAAAAAASASSPAAASAGGEGLPSSGGLSLQPTPTRDRGSTTGSIAGLQGPMPGHSGHGGGGGIASFPSTRLPSNPTSGAGGIAVAPAYSASGSARPRGSTLESTGSLPQGAAAIAAAAAKAHELHSFQVLALSGGTAPLSPAPAAINGGMPAAAPAGAPVGAAVSLAPSSSSASSAAGGSLIRPEAAARAAELLAGMGGGARARSGSASGSAALALPPAAVAPRPGEAGGSAFSRPNLGAAGGSSLRNVVAGGAVVDPGVPSVTRQASASSATAVGGANAGAGSGSGAGAGSGFAPVAPADGNAPAAAAIDRKPSQLNLPLGGAAAGAAAVGANDAAEKANAAVAAATAAAERRASDAGVSARPGATARPLPQDTAADRAGRRWGASSGGVVAATKAFDAQLAAVQLRIPGDASSNSATDYAIAAHIANRASEARREAQHTWTWPYRIWRALLDRLVLTTTFALAILLILIGALLHQVYPDRTIWGSPAWQWLYLVGALVAALLPLTILEWMFFLLLEKSVSCCGVVGAEVLSFAYCAKGHLAHIGVVIFALDVSAEQCMG